MGRARGGSRPQGSIERRGKSLRVSVYAGVDPLTGKRLYLRDSTTDEAEAKRILNRFRNQVDEQRNASTRGLFRLAVNEWLKLQKLEASTREAYELYVERYILPALGDEPVSTISVRTLETLYAELGRCRKRCDGKPFVEHVADGPHECRVVKHRRPPGRMPAAGYPPHDCAEKGCKVIECAPHACSPLADATILKVHFIISGALSAAVRWEWIASNPAEVTKKPKTPTPEPDPPTADQAGRIAAAAWDQDPAWGTLVWLAMVTGLRRAELLALRWYDIDLAQGVVGVRRGFVATRSQKAEKKTKTNRMRRISLDPDTVAVLSEHRGRLVDTRRKLGLDVGSASDDDAFVFSYQSTHDAPCDPSGVTHRYKRMCRELGIDTHLHALRHYSATELLTAGVDLRTVAGRLGHGGGGATTLRVYAAWVGESDRRAAEILGGRFKRPSNSLVPTSVSTAVAARWPERGAPWLANVDRELAELCTAHGASIERALPARYGLVVEAVGQSGQRLIMRSTPDPAGREQARALEVLAATGLSPAVYEVRSTEFATWTVMERVTPGTPVELGSGVAELAEVLRPLVVARPQVAGLPSLFDWLHHRLTNGAGEDLAPGYDGPATPEERDSARQTLEELRAAVKVSLCHGDCSRGNVLRSSDGLRLIDPRGMCGDVAYDAAVLAFKTANNPRDLAIALDLDPDRADKWTSVAVTARV